MKAIIRKTLSTLLSLSLTLGMVSFFGVGGVVEAKGEEEITWTDITCLEDIKTYFGNDTDYTGPQYYRLTSNITNGSGTVSSSNPVAGSTLYIKDDDEIVLDLSGYNITTTVNRVSFQMSGGAHLTIKDSSSPRTGYISGNLASDTDNARKNRNVLFIVNSGSQLTLDGVTVRNGRNYYTSSTETGKSGTYEHRGAGFYVGAGSVLTVKGGSVISDFEAMGQYLLKAGDKDYNSSGSIGAGCGGAIVTYGGNVNLYDCTIENCSALDRGGAVFARSYTDYQSVITIGSEDYGYPLITGCSAVSGGAICGQGVSAAKTQIVINGGQFINNTKTTYGASVRNDTNSSTEINGGVFYSDAATSFIYEISGTTSNSSQKIVKGGWYKHQVNTSYMAEGYNLTGKCDDAIDLRSPYTVAESQSYTVSYDVSGDTGSNQATAPASSTGTHGSGVALAAYVPVNGKNFAGWTMNAEGTGEVLAAGSAYEFSKDITLYAKLVNNYTITYMDGETALSGLTQSVEPGLGFTVHSYSKPNYVFDKWVCGEDQYASGDSVTPSGNMTLTAVWKKVASIGATEYESFEAAVNGAASGSTVTLLEDIDTDTYFQIANKTLTMDLNDKILTYSGEARLLYSSEKGIFTFRNGTIKADKPNDDYNKTGGIFHIAGKGSLTLDDITLTGSEDAVLTTADGGGIIVNDSELIIKDSTISNIRSGGHGGAVLIQTRSSATMENVTFQNCHASGTNKDGGAVYVSKGTTLNMDADCSIDNCSAARKGNAIYVYADGTSIGTAKLASSSIISNCGEKPICSVGFVYIGGQMTTDGVVDQTATAARFATIAGEISDVITAKVGIEVALKTGDTVVIEYKNGQTVSEELADSGSYVRNTVQNINRIATPLELVLKNGDTVIDNTCENYTILDYFNTLVTSEEAALSNEQKTFMANLIVYADLLQQYAAAKGYSNPGTAVERPDWVDGKNESIKWATEDNPTSEDNHKETTSTAINASLDKILSAYLNVADRISLRFNIRKQTDSSVRVMCGERVLAEGTDYTLSSGGLLSINRFAPGNYNDVYTISIIDDDNPDPALHAITYSVYSYCYGKSGDTTRFDEGDNESPTVGDLAKAIYNYGKAAEAVLASN